MHIEVKKRRDRNESMYIFYFANKDEFEGFLYFLESNDEYENTELKEMVQEFANKFKSRVNDKYATEDFPLSGCLFADEMAQFAAHLIRCFIRYKIEQFKTEEKLYSILDGYEDIVNRYEKLFEENNRQGE